uniref:Uncharacterized protein n=1 Tax=Felis catus TaxID=9685 RepID=A0ABI7W3W1_FELCA
MLRNGIAGSHGSSTFNFLRNLHTVFRSSCTNIHCHQECIHVSFSPHPHPHLLFLVFLMIATLTDVKEYLLGVVIHIFLMTRDVEHLFIYLLVICMSSLEKCLYTRCSSHFFNW